MKVTANLNYLRLAPRKVRLVAGLIRGMDAKEAEIQLKFLGKRAADPILKLLKSAISNASHDFNIEKDNLFVSEIQVNEGKPFKRWRARAMGRAYPITKRTSHIKLVVETKTEVKVKKTKKTKPEIVKLKEGATPKGGEPRPEVSGREENKPIPKPKPIPPQRPYSTTPKSKIRFFSRQTFGNIKKAFRRKAF